MSKKHWTYEKDGSGLGWLGIDKADGSVNVLSAPVLRELDELLADIEVDLPAGLVIYSRKPGGFIMGADINEFTRIDSAAQAYELVRQGQRVSIGWKNCPARRSL